MPISSDAEPMIREEIRRARQALNARRLEDVHEHCKRVLAIDSQNRDALQLIAQAEIGRTGDTGSSKAGVLQPLKTSNTGTIFEVIGSDGPSDPNHEPLDLGDLDEEIWRLDNSSAQGAGAPPLTEDTPGVK